MFQSAIEELQAKLKRLELLDEGDRIEREKAQRVADEKGTALLQRAAERREIQSAITVLVREGIGND